MTSRRQPAFLPQAEGLEGRQLLTAPGTLDPTFGLGGSALGGAGNGGPFKRNPIRLLAGVTV